MHTLTLPALVLQVGENLDLQVPRVSRLQNLGLPLPYGLLRRARLNSLAQSRHMPLSAA